MNIGLVEKGKGIEVGVITVTTKVLVGYGPRGRAGRMKGQGLAEIRINR